MKSKTVFGWLLIIILSLIPVLLLFTLGNGMQVFHNYGSLTHVLGQIFGLVGMTMFALTFMLSTRARFIEELFGGLDKVYIVHGIFGGLALLFILFHPIFLVLKFVPSAMGYAAKYLLPSNSWSVNFGIIALLGLILLICFTLYSKMKYNKWKFTHEFLGIMFILAVLHIFLVRNTVAQDNIFNGYFVYAGVVSAIGIIAFIYSLVIRGELIRNSLYKVIELDKHGDFFEVTMNSNNPIDYKSGQFVFVKFYNRKVPSEAHPFSIASKSGDENLKIVVKKLGDYTMLLENLNVGDKVSVEGPYGKFNYKNYDNHDQVWIAAGIGITPFLGMAEDLLDDDLHRVTLFYSVKDEKDFVGYKLLEEVSAKNNRFKFVPWNTSKQGFITAKHIFEHTGKSARKEFFICGPPAFKDAIVSGLIKEGVSGNKIHNEEFGFR